MGCYSLVYFIWIKTETWVWYFVLNSKNTWIQELKVYTRVTPLIITPNYSLGDFVLLISTILGCTGMGVMKSNKSILLASKTARVSLNYKLQLPRTPCPPRLLISMDQMTRIVINMLTRIMDTEQQVMVGVCLLVCLFALQWGQGETHGTQIIHINTSWYSLAHSSCSNPGLSRIYSSSIQILRNESLTHTTRESINIYRCDSCAQGFRMDFVDGNE